MSLLDPRLLPIHAAFIFVLGLLWGSFFNVVVWRVPRRFSIVLPGSHCPICGTPIRWHDNVPLLSQVMLGQRCRVCGSKFSWRYFGVELLTGLIWVSVFLRFGWSGATAVYLVFVSLLVVATFTDIDHWIIPDSVSIGGLVFGLLVAVGGAWYGAEYFPANEWPVWGHAVWRPLANAAIGACVGWFIMQSIALMGRLIFRKEAMGGGDIVLMAMFGAFLGWQGVLATLVISCFIGVFLGGSLLMMDKLRERRRGGPLPEPAHRIPESINPSTPDGFNAAVAHLDLHRKERSVSTHLPFGPYLCMAAYAVLIAWPVIERTLYNLYVAPLVD